jgi:predicted oxidoreductase
MKYYDIKNSDLRASNLILGLMRISNMKVEEVEKLVITALENGINFFDHADIYGKGKSEELFGEVLKRNPELRSKMIIQTKCGIRQGFFDSSKEHILNSVDKALERLNTDYLDVLLIHRPDALTDYEEVAEAFKILRNNKKVRFFGVSNFNSLQIELLQKYLPNKLVFNQMQLSIVHSTMIDEQLNVNMMNNLSVNRSGSVIDYLRLKNITMQAWSPLLASWENGGFLDNPLYPELNVELEKLSKQYNVSKAAIAVAWILKHPANIQAIIGTTSLAHLEEIVKANDVILTKEEWYRLYLSNNKMLP